MTHFVPFQGLTPPRWSYGKWLANADLPKLFINAGPGSILTGKQRETCRSWPKQQEVTVKGLHFIQEDSPAEIGEAIAGFVKGILDVS
jgi:haloalkane dehalogenase